MEEEVGGVGGGDGREVRGWLGVVETAAEVVGGRGVFRVVSEVAHLAVIPVLPPAGVGVPFWAGRCAYQRKNYSPQRVSTRLSDKKTPIRGLPRDFASLMLF